MAGDSSEFDEQDSASAANLITRICSHMQSMPEAERRIAEYITRHQSATVSLSQAELASECGVSAATISRFCRRMGERDFHAFKVSLAQSISLLHGSAQVDELDKTVRSDAVKSSLESLLSNQIASITRTIRSIDESNFRLAVERICNARMMVVAAAGRSIPVALDAAYKFERIGIACSTSEYYEKLLSSALCLTEDDVLLIVSRSGWSGTLQQILHAARDRGAFLLLITATDRSCPLARDADVVFTTTATDAVLDGTLGNSRLSEMAVIEALYAFVSARRGDARERIDLHGSYVLSRVDLP